MILCKKIQVQDDNRDLEKQRYWMKYSAVQACDDLDNNDPSATNNDPW